MRVTIERASIHSLDTLCEIEKKCFQDDAFERQQIAYLITSSDIEFLVGRVRRKIIGFVAGRIYTNGQSKSGHMLTIDVLPEYRRRGIGFRLLKKIERIFIDEGIGICNLEVRENNIPALNLYRKAGYVRVRILKNYYIDSHGILFQKTLS